MTSRSEQWNRVKDLLSVAAALPQSERDSYLKCECTDDAALLAEVQSLLAAHRHADGFLEPLTGHSDALVAPWLRETAERLELRSCPSPGDQPLPERALNALRAAGLELREEISRGGTAIVYRGYEARLNRSVAIKIPRLDAWDKQSRSRFVHEAKAMAGVRHEHVATIYSVIEIDDDQLCLVMEYLPGVSLREHLKQGRPLDAAWVAEVLAQIGEGLAAAHRAGLIHRDVKPSNIQVEGPFATNEPVDGGQSTPCAAPRAKLMDFGIVHLGDATKLTRHGEILGTPHYMSPEQIRSPEQVDTRSDVYSLGVTLYECLTGVPPWRGPLVAVLSDIVDRDPVAPRLLNRSVPVDLETICLKALSKSPRHRYQSAEEMAADLRRWCRGEPILARPAGRIKRFWRWSLRRPVAASLVTSLMLALVTVGASLLWQSHQAMEQARRAEAGYYRLIGAIRSPDQPGDAAADGPTDPQGMFQKAIAQQVAALSGDGFDAPDAMSVLVSFQYGLANQQIDTGQLAEAEATALTIVNTLERWLPGREDTALVQNLRGWQAASHLFIGELRHRVGALDEALQQYALAEQVWVKQVADKCLMHRWCERNLALVRCLIGHVHRDRGDLRQSRSCYQEAASIAQRVVQQGPLDPAAPYPPADFDLVHIAAFTEHFLGVQCREEGRPQAAIEHLQRALSGREQLANRPNPQFRWRRDRAETLHQIGLAALDAGQRGAGLETLRQACAQFEELCSQSVRTDVRAYLGQANLHLADVLHLSDEQEERSKRIERARQLGHELFDRDSLTTVHRAILAESHCQRGLVECERNAFDRAAESLQKSLALWTAATRSSQHDQWSHARCLRALGYVHLQLHQHELARDDLNAACALLEPLVIRSPQRTVRNEWNETRELIAQVDEQFGEKVDSRTNSPDRPEATQRPSGHAD